VKNAGVIRNGKRPYAIARRDGQPMAFADLWESFCWSDETVIRTFAIAPPLPCHNA
jgi:putative SOS response-associated peptidase YedK